jgi:pyruvate/2-oxoglutarate dehydrogenase complex dihydrolipoamide dehydrogenase (E3) component
MLARIQVVIAKSEGGEQTIEGTHLLVAAGRQPNIEDLDLDAAGIRHEPHGIVVDKYLRTRNKKVYAIGDVVGGPKFTHVANHHAGLVVRNALFRNKVAIDRRTLPWVIYTDPELAQIGFLEDEARAHAGAISILRWPYRENDRAVATGATNGHVKVITDRRGGILGVTIVGAAASENIAIWSLAVGQKLKIGALAGLIVPLPTYAEVGKRAAITYFMRGLTSSRVRRIIVLLRRFGGNG